MRTPHYEHDSRIIEPRKCGKDRVRERPDQGNRIERFLHLGRQSSASVFCHFPLIVEALVRLRSRSCIIDGEAVVCDDNGVASFDRIRHRRHDGDTFLYAFDLIELNGDDMRRDPLEVRKATLRCMLAKAGLGLRFNEHLEGDGSTVFRPRLQDGTRRHRVEAKGHRSGRSPDWLKMKNPDAPAVKREAEEDWGR